MNASVGGNEIMGAKVYIFGSMLFSCTPRDVDLVVVFDPVTTSIPVMIEFRRHLRQSAIEEFKTVLDICLLTNTEARKNSFLEDEGAVLVHCY